MKKTISAIVVLMVMMFGVSCKNGAKKTMSSKEIIEKVGTSGLNKGTKDFTVDLPKDWTSIDTVINGLKFRFMFPPADAIGKKNANVNILNETMHQLSFEDYMKKTEESLGSGMEGYKKINSGDIEAGATKGKWLHYTFREGNMDAECIVYIFPSDEGVAYIMTAATTKDKMEQYRNTFDAIAKSFKFTN